ncbi:MAG: tRNA 2-thiocytidine(32) synthetase TtcA [Oscillospiraceae bacterium]|nr:tRNA 2-thiocytidine(32) synthetase TtcA [Oscillospiraceae bacterium]
MNKILSHVRRCVEDYDMIQPGDRLAVGVSGGKDSLVLLDALYRLSSFFPVPFSLEAITLDLGLPDMDFSPVADWCESRHIPYTLKKTEIARIIFDERKEKNPCSMCAKMRRGALNDLLLERGISKLALGHHFDDAVETFYLSLIYEGRLSCFQPVTYMERSGITQIRPLLYCKEGHIRTVAQREGLPVVQNSCPADKETKRQEIKDLLSELSQRYPRIKDYTFGAMQRLPLPAWAPNHDRDKRCSP